MYPRGVVGRNEFQSGLNAGSGCSGHRVNQQLVEWLRAINGHQSRPGLAQWGSRLGNQQHRPDRPSTIAIGYLYFGRLCPRRTRLATAWPVVYSGAWG
jgi:hypothetical protein